MNKDVYVIIPVYNEEIVIGEVIEEIEKHYSNIICVNDGSQDGSAVAIMKTKAFLVNHPINLGQGAALQTGIEYALLDSGAKYFVTFDADGQHQIKDVAMMLKILKNEKLDIVLGSRFLGKAENITYARKLILKAAIKFTNKTSGIKLTDAHNGIRAFTRKVAEELNISNPDMSHASEIIEKIAANKYKYKEIPVTITYTEHSRTKGQSLFNAINIGLDILFDRIIR
jgi:polyprenyl-phospho-N-acetylgalactosaminyl synthase